MAIDYTLENVTRRMASLSLAQHLLRHWAVEAVPISTDSDEQSDFIVSLGRSRFLIEEKTKFDDPEAFDERRKTLASGKLHASTKPMVRTNRMSGIVRKAVGQLESSARSHDHDFRLVWLTGTGPNAEAYYEQFIASLYGKTRIIELNSRYMKPCYFFRNSEFHRYANALDGAVAAYIHEGKLSARLCLNPLSPRFPQLLRTKFRRLFGTAVENPLQAERSRRAYVLTSSTDRGQETQLLHELQQKYRTGPLMKFDIGFTTVAIRV